MIRRKLHDKGSGITGEHSCLLEHNAGYDDSRNADEIRAGSHPRSAAEESARNQGNYRKLCAAGNECCRHDSHTSVAFILDGARSHDCRNAAARADQHWNEGFAGKTEFTEDSVHDKGDSRHVAAAFKEREEEEQYKHLRQESENRANAADDTVNDKTAQPLRATQRVKPAADQIRNTWNPYAVIRMVGFFDFQRLLIVDIADRNGFFDFAGFFVHYVIARFDLCKFVDGSGFNVD